ncbi:MAG: hypothetical protein WCQ60_02345 [bacterium]
MKIIKNKIIHTRGFIALITTIIVSTALMLMAISVSSSAGLLFDEVIHKEYRIAATTAALSCLDTVFMELERDYFYIVEDIPMQYPDMHCSVYRVKSNGQGGIHTPTSVRNVIAKGYSGISSTTPGSITATVTAQVLINFQTISLMSEITTF